MKIKNIFVAIFAFLIMISGQLKACAYNADNMLEPYMLKRGEILFGQSKRVVDAVNPTPASNKAGSYFPGARGANQLVIYTRDYGERTHTNEFGTEAIIVGNTVTDLSGADSFIPENGAVISGHGLGKQWITSNITVGTKIYYDETSGVVTTYTTSDSLVFEARSKIDEAKNMISYYRYRNPTYDWETPLGYIQTAENYLKRVDRHPEEAQKYSQMAIQSANTALKSVLPYKKSEFKGVWLRPTETSEQAIINSIIKLKKSGIDNVFIETYFHGRTIFPSKTMEKYGFISQNEKFAGFDPLAVWIREAHKNNIKVHIWFETFYVGNQSPNSNPENILAVKPEWGNKTGGKFESANPTPSASEHNGYFIDPANPDVQDFLYDLLSEIITTYKPDGINLDYIRYPHAISTSFSSSWGFTEFARNDFYNKYGKDPVQIKTNDPLWYQWNLYKRQKVTDFVAKISKLCSSKNVYLSAVIFPDRQAALSLKQQDWQAWSENNYIKGFTPLFLTCNSNTLNSMLTEVMSHKAADTDLFAGLFVTFMGGSEEDLIREIHETRKLDINGVILFDFAHLDDKYINAISTRAFKSSQNVSSTQPKLYTQPQPQATQPLLVPSDKKKKNSLIFK